MSFKFENFRLVIYNLSMDSNNHALRFTQDWVEEFSKHFCEVVVYSTHVGNYRKIGSVKVVELGGGSPPRRVIALLRLGISVVDLYKYRKSTLVFHHMSTFTTVFPGILFKSIGVLQALWYSHSFSDKYLKVGARFMNAIFSPHRESFPLKSPYLPLHFSGHGISSQYVQEFSKEIDLMKDIEILSVGRIVRIKRLEEIIELCGRLKESIKVRIIINLIGPINDIEYLNSLKDLANQNGVRVVFTGPLETCEIIEFYKKSHFYYMGTPKSVDKSALEACFFGCIPLSTNIALQELTGLDVLFRYEKDILDSMVLQLNHFLELDKDELKDVSEEIRKVSRANNSLENLIPYIVRTLSVIKI